MKMNIVAIIAVLVSIVSLPAMAEVKLTVASDNVVNGIVRSTDDLVVQAGVDLESKSGLFVRGNVSTWNPVAEGDVEVTANAGGGVRLGNDTFDVEVGGTYYYFTGTQLPTDQVDYVTANAAVTLADFVTVGAEYAVNLNTTAAQELVVGDLYSFVGVKLPLSDTLALNAKFGHSRYEGEAQYNDYSAGVSKEFNNGFSARVDYVRNDFKDSALDFSSAAAQFREEDRFVLSLSKSF